MRTWFKRTFPSILFLCWTGSNLALSSCKSEPSNHFDKENTNESKAEKVWKTAELKIGYGKCNSFNENEGCLEIFFVDRSTRELALYGLRTEWLRTKISQNKLDEIDRILMSKDFQDRMKSQNICEIDPAWRGSVRVIHESGESETIGLQGDCIRAHLTKEDPNNALHRLFLSLEKVKRTALSCPVWDPQLKNAEDYDLLKNPLPLSWPCFTCRGACDSSAPSSKSLKSSPVQSKVLE